MKIVYMGTPDIAAYPLEALLHAGHDVVCVITGKDKARGRSGELTPTPVKKVAQQYGLKIYHPDSFKDETTIDYLKSFNADIFVVIAYGRILPKAVLDIPKYGCINIHASLLPSYRGAAPIQWAVIDGKEKTGITTMLMNEGLDTGDIIKQYPVNIDADETGGSLFDKLTPLAGVAIVDTIKEIEERGLYTVPQGETDTEYASQFTREDGNIDWNLDPISIERRIRGLDPWPGSYTFLDSKLIKIWKTSLLNDLSLIEDYLNTNNISDLTPGGIIRISDRLFVKCKESYLEINEMQLEGKKRMDIKSLLNGFNISTGKYFTSVK